MTGRGIPSGPRGGLARLAHLRRVGPSLLRIAVVALPPLLVATVLFAAPKGAPPPPKKAPTTTAAPKPKWTPKPKAKPKPDADVEPSEYSTAPSSADAGPKEKEPLKADASTSAPTGKAGAGKSEADPNGPEVKESERKEGDAAVKVFEFGTTDIEGRTRWPAVTYFVRRMRAEFEAQRLPHRSFLPEMKATKGDPGVK
ncbi:MAG: hypothetical protein NVS3B10_01270 [Polyangiales bacterium]